MPVASATPGKKVCVTGAGGYIASHLVKQLLEKGYTVNGTVRDPSDEKKNGHLKSLRGAADRLTLFPVELEGPASAFEPAIGGCECIFHTATPTSLAPDAKDSFEPGMAGVKNLLQAIAGQRKASQRSGGEEVLKCLVLTSSMAAMALPESWGGPAPPRVFSEDTWQDESEQKDRAFWYGACKTQQEKEILTFQEETSATWRYVVINPAFVIGQMLQPAPIVSLSMEIFASYLGETREVAQNDSMFFVEVGDVARLHIAGFENEQASGRYMACYGEAVELELEENEQDEQRPEEHEEVELDDAAGTKVLKAWAAPHFNEIYKTLAKLCPNFKPPADYIPGVGGEEVPKQQLHYDLRRMNTLVPVETMMGMEEMFRVSINALRERNALPEGF